MSRICHMHQWDEICRIKNIFLAHCGWGNFRKHLYSQKLMTSDDMAPGELERYALQLDTDIRVALDIVNSTISHEMNLDRLLKKHFNSLSRYLLSKPYTKETAQRHAHHMWRPSTLDKVFPDGYCYIEYDRHISRARVSGDVDSNCVIVIRAKPFPRHMMGAYKRDNQWYFIDPNADQIDTQLSGFLPKMSYCILNMPLTA